MHKHNPSSAVRNILFFSIVFLIAVADQASKLWIRTHLLLGQSIPETGFFRLTYGQNTGAIFGMFQGNSDTFIILAIIVAILVLVYFFLARKRYPFLDTRLNTMASGLVLGGIVGNLIDRIQLGYVTDFISVGPWPDFNIADSSGVVGVVLFTYSILLVSRDITLEQD